VFAAPLAPGARVTIQYAGLGYTNNAVPQRYQAGLRIDRQFAGLPGAEVGLTYHRLWDENLPQGSDPAASGLGVSAAPAGDLGLVSDTVFGLDFQLPLAFARGGDVMKQPLLFGEFAASRFTPDQQFIAVTGATAAVAGLKLTFARLQATLQYQTVGANYIDGAPLRFYGNAPPVWANYADEFAPQFFGFGNTLGINQTFDASIDAAFPGRSQTATNPALTFLYPVFNPFVAGGPDFYSAFAPNTQGPSLTLNGPLRIAAVRAASHPTASVGEFDGDVRPGDCDVDTRDVRQTRCGRAVPGGAVRRARRRGSRRHARTSAPQRHDRSDLRALQPVAGRHRSGGAGERHRGRRRIGGGVRAELHQHVSHLARRRRIATGFARRHLHDAL
jgi:hypothetical protein